MHSWPSHHSCVVCPKSDIAVQSVNTHIKLIKPTSPTGYNNYYS